MPKTKRVTRRTRSTPTQIRASASALNQRACHGSSHSEPAVHTSPSISTQSDYQNVQPTESESKNQPKYKTYWKVELIDEGGVMRKTRLRLRDLNKLHRRKKVIIEWNEEGKPAGGASGLFINYLHDLAYNAYKLPVNYDNWSVVPSTYKDRVWNECIRAKFQVNDEEHKKWILSYIGDAWERNRGWMYHEYYDSSRDVEENIQWGPERIPLEQWASLLTEICNKSDSGSTERSRSSTLSDGVTSNELLNNLKLELQATRARIQVLEEQVAFLMQYVTGQIPPNFNQGAYLGAQVEEVVSSSSAGHEPQNQGP